MKAKAPSSAFLPSNPNFDSSDSVSRPQHERGPHHCRWLWGAQEIDGLVPPAAAVG